MDLSFTPEKRESTLKHIISSKSELIRDNPELFFAIQRKLLKLVVVDNWTDGRRYYEPLGLNRIIEASFTIEAFTGLSVTGFELS